MMIQTTSDIYAGFLFGATLLLANVPTLLTVREIKLRHEHNVNTLRGVMDMAFRKMVETVPVEKREALSDKLIDLVLTSKNDEKMPAGLANTLLYHWQRNLLASDAGLVSLLEAAFLLEPDKTIEVLEQEFQLVGTVKAVKEVFMKAEK